MSPPRSGPTSHWFRYEATANLDTGTWDCSLYDMGLAHPELNTPKGALVHSWKNLRCRAPADEGLSSICVYGQGMVGFDPWDVYNPGAGLLDNIRVEKVPSGCLVLVR